MEILNMESSQVEETTEQKGGNDLTSLLAEYGQPAEISTQGTPGIQQPVPSATTIQTPGTTNPTSENWRGDNRYYQTGRKAGTLRPNGPKVVYNQNNIPASISGDLITGAMFLTMVNLLFPVLISALHNLTVKKKEDKIKWSALAMSAEQERKLSPIADKVAQKIIMTWSPEGILFFSMLGLYVMNYAIARMEKSMDKTK